jgi:hypothetical protein
MVTGKDKDRLMQTCASLGVDFNEIEKYLSDTSFDKWGGESWVELDSKSPGDLNDNLVLVNCYNSNQPGSVTRRSYSYISYPGLK